MKLTDLKNRKDIGILLNELGLVGLGVEIGVAYGENAYNILSHWQGRLILVDPWKTQPEDEYIDGSAHIDFDGALNYCLENLKQFDGKFTTMRLKSDDAAKMFIDDTLDFVYLDGNHHNPQFTRDVLNWYPKVKKGGIFGGHDYMDLDTPEYRCEVKKVIDDFAAKNNITLHLTNGDNVDLSWWIQKT